MSTEALHFQGYALVAAALTAKPGLLTDAEAEARAAGAILAAVDYLRTHLGEETARRALDSAAATLPARLLNMRSDPS